MARRAKDDRGLTDKQELFCREVALDPECSDVEAFRRAYSTERMKPETIQKRANELKNKGVIAGRIAELRLAQLERFQVDKDFMLARLFEEVQADMASLFNEDGSFKHIKDLPEVWRRGLIAGFEFEELKAGEGGERVAIGRMVKLKLSDRVKRLELLGKHIDVSAFVERVHHSADELLRQAMADVSDKCAGLPPPLPAGAKTEKS